MSSGSPDSAISPASPAAPPRPSSPTSGGRPAIRVGEVGQQPVVDRQGQHLRPAVRRLGPATRAASGLGGRRSIRGQPAGSTVPGPRIASSGPGRARGRRRRRAARSRQACGGPRGGRLAGVPRTTGVLQLAVGDIRIVPGNQGSSGTTRSRTSSGWNRVSIRSGKQHPDGHRVPPVITSGSSRSPRISTRTGRAKLGRAQSAGRRRWIGRWRTGNRRAAPRRPASADRVRVEPLEAEEAHVGAEPPLERRAARAARRPVGSWSKSGPPPARRYR